MCWLLGKIGIHSAVRFSTNQRKASMLLLSSTVAPIVSRKEAMLSLSC